MELYFFLFFATVAVACGIAMILQRNLIYCVLLLIMVMVSLAGLFLMLNAQFVAAIQIVVYTGAIMVLFLFVIMLLNLSREEGSAFRIQKPLAVMALLLLFAATLAIIAEPWIDMGPPVNEVEGLVGLGEVENIGRVLFTTYLLPVEIAAVLLLVAIVGVVVLTRRGVVQSHEG